MLLISANLIQLFGPDNVPCGFTRWAWMTDSGSIVACVILLTPDIKVQLVTSQTADLQLFASKKLEQNKRISLKLLLESKQTYHKAMVHILRVAAMDLEQVILPIDDLMAMQQKITVNPTAVAETTLEPHTIVWFWDRYYSSFVKLGTEDEWTETVTLVTSADHQGWDQSMQYWKTLTLDIFDTEDSPVILFICFNGHQIAHSWFLAHVLRVNQLLAALLNDEFMLPTTTWIPSLLCPYHSCTQRITPAFVMRKAIAAKLIMPSVAETTELLRLLKRKWNIT
jgi:hypothetical protein